MSLEEQRFASHWAELSQFVEALWRSQRSVGVGGSHCVAHQQSHPDRIWLCRFAHPSRSLSATADVATDLAIIEQFARFSVGVRDRPCVQGGVRTRFHQCLYPRSGLCRVQRVGQSPGGGDRRRLVQHEEELQTTEDQLSGSQTKAHLELVGVKRPVWWFLPRWAVCWRNAWCSDMRC